MSGGASLPAAREEDAGALARGLGWLNRWLAAAGMVALVAAAVVLTGSVVMRYFLRLPTEWQDETSVFLLVGAVFLSAGYVQSHRGHVGIEAIAGLLPERANRIRLLLVDLVSLAFCAFFAWKSWTLLREAVADHQTTSSSWAPPLWIPYAAMASGMTILSLQILTQLSHRPRRGEGA
ncbi:MAG TPA: TRAP transporter small permease [Anaeromyxobacteraceae bacterium]|nr:TRAP transporter small permease [Anaeromyxobacteraceae bacterium]